MVGREERVKRVRQVAMQRQPDMSVCLENVMDLHNFGAVLRSCDAVGLAEVYALQHSDAVKNKPFILGKRSSMGTRKWIECNLYNDPATCIRQLKKRYVRLLAAVPGTGSVSLYDLDLCSPFVFVFGNEREGISDTLLSQCTTEFYIPQFGMADSLNLSVACAVSLYEAMRQRTLAGMYKDDYQEFLKERMRLAAEYGRLALTKSYPTEAIPELEDIDNKNLK